MDVLERLKTQYRSFSLRRAAALLAMALGVALCLTVVVISRYPSPDDPLTSRYRPYSKYSSGRVGSPPAL